MIKENYRNIKMSEMDLVAPWS